MKANRAAIARHSVGVALVIPSPMIRGVLKAILWIEPMPQPHKLCAGEAEAVAWLKERLAAAKAPPPASAATRLRN
jgi:hypothetical protein